MHLLLDCVPAGIHVCVVGNIYDVTVQAQLISIYGSCSCISCHRRRASTHLPWQQAIQCAPVNGSFVITPVNRHDRKTRDIISATHVCTLHRVRGSDPSVLGLAIIWQRPDVMYVVSAIGATLRYTRGKTFHTFNACRIDATLTLRRC